MEDKKHKHLEQEKKNKWERNGWWLSVPDDFNSQVDVELVQKIQIEC